MNRKAVTIISITIFSIMLWVFISLSEDHFAIKNVPIKMENIPKGFALSSISNKSVAISVKGKGWLLGKFLSDEDVEFIVTCENDSGKLEFDLRALLNRNSWLSSNVQVLEVVPSKIYCEIERVYKKTVPVVADLDFDFKTGYNRISEIKMVPNIVDLSGPKSLIENINYISSEKKSLKEIDKNFGELISLKSIENVTFSAEKINVSFEVQKIVDKRFRDIEIEIRKIPRNRELALYPPKVDILLRGGIDRISKMNNDSLSAYIYFSQADKDTLGFVTPSIIVPKFISVISINPQYLEYIIKQN